MTRKHTLLNVASSYIKGVATLKKMVVGGRPVGARGAGDPPDFGKSVNPTSTRRGILCPTPIYSHSLERKKVQAFCL